ncbi:Glycosyltransferase 2-like domain-containing protein [Plasmodiophora brassicae]
MLAVTNSGTSPRQPQVLTSDRFIYDEQNAPFLNETVAEYRTRLNSVDIDDDDTIFVSIATYRDDACPGTIQTMMTAASRPDRVFVGLVDQTNLDDPHTDDIQCHARLPDDIRKRVRLVRMRHVNARGPTHARHIASKLWDGERFFLMIDAHSTFRDGWDRILIDNIRQLPNPSKAVISHYPPGDAGELHKDAPVTWICKAEDHEQSPPGLFVLAQDYCQEPNWSPHLRTRPRGTCSSAFIGGGLFFLHSSFLRDVPFDPFLPYLFHGEEVLIAARLYTSGYDMYAPAQNVLSHVYGGRDKNIYDDHAQNGMGVDASGAEARARYILGLALADDMDVDLRGIEDGLGMGNVRPLQEYMAFAGLGKASDKVYENRCLQRFETHGWVDAYGPAPGETDGS